MKKNVLLFAAVILAATAGLYSCNSANGEIKQPVAVISKDSLIKRGSYLVNSIGCDDCHSPKIVGPNGVEVDPARRFGGHPANSPLPKPNTSVMKDGYMLFSMDLTSAVGPWGQSYAANISSDATGIGNWTEEQFFRAIREGKSKGLKESRPLLPPMPWPVYRNMSDQDLRAIFAFLQSTQPVENRVPGPKPIETLK